MSQASGGPQPPSSDLPAALQDLPPLLPPAALAAGAAFLFSLGLGTGWALKPVLAEARAAERLAADASGASFPSSRSSSTATAAAALKLAPAPDVSAAAAAAAAADLQPDEYATIHVFEQNTPSVVNITNIR